MWDKEEQKPSTTLDFPLAQKPTVHIYTWWVPVLFPWFHLRVGEAKELRVVNGREQSADGFLGWVSTERVDALITLQSCVDGGVSQCVCLVSQYKRSPGERVG